MSWTGPKELQAQVVRLWDRGLVLRSLLSDEPLFPKRLTLQGPTSRDLAHAFAKVRDWCESIAKMQRIRIVLREVNHRVTGSNAYPSEAWIDTPEDAVALLGRIRDWERFRHIVESTRQRRPALLLWLARKPLIALERADDWERILDLIDWIQARPRPGCYLRQVDMPGIDTKFIEAHRGLLAELFDLVLPEQAIDLSPTGVAGFCARYGFRDKPERIRFRTLDPAIDPLGLKRHSDIALDVDSMAALQVTPATVFITENETNFLAFPDAPNAWILFGAGYGFAPWKRIAWFQRCRIFYWGDIDTHGFAALDEFRSHFPTAQSFLMDRATLLAHEPLWGSEPRPCPRSLDRLTEPENALYQDLQHNRFGRQIRLEQERVSYRFLTSFTSSLRRSPL